MQFHDVRQALGQSSVDPFSVRIDSRPARPARDPIGTRLPSEVAAHRLPRHPQLPGDPPLRLTLPVSLVDLLKSLDTPPALRPLDLESRRLRGRFARRSRG